LLKIGRSDNPQAALEDERTKAREGMAKTRATNVSRNGDHEIVTVQSAELDEDDDEADSEPATSETVVEEAERRQRGFLACVSQGLHAAEDAHHHVDWFIDNAPIDDEMLRVAAAATATWMGVLSKLQREQASTLPQDGRSEVPVSPRNLPTIFPKSRQVSTGARASPQKTSKADSLPKYVEGSPHLQRNQRRRVQRRDDGGTA
jgi:hypothetical protein